MLKKWRNMNEITCSFDNVAFYTRVTEVLAPFSGIDKIDKAVLEAACQRGTAVHEIIECMQEGLPTGDIPDHLLGYIESYDLWVGDKKFIKKPDRFFDKELMITGECDCLYQDNEGLILVDFKTSTSEGKTWKYQGSAYSYLAKRNGYDIKRIEFVKVSKDGKRANTYSYKEDMDSFRRLLEIYREFFKYNKEDMGDL